MADMIFNFIYMRPSWATLHYGVQTHFEEKLPRTYISDFFLGESVLLLPIISNQRQCQLQKIVKILNYSKHGCFSSIKILLTGKKMMAKGSQKHTPISKGYCPF